MEILIPILIVGVLVLIIWGAIAAHKAHKARIAALSAWASSKGWSFSEHDHAGFDDRYRHFSLFNNGHSRRASNIIRGELTINRRPHPVVLCDYVYVTTSTDSKGRTTNTHHHHSVCLVHTPYNLPGFTIRREHLFDKIGGALGFDDIDFEDAEFSKRFHVKSKDRRFAYDLMSPRMIEYFQELDSRLKGKVPALDLQEGELLIYTTGHWKTAHDFQHALDLAEGFIDRFPDHMLAQLEGDSSFRTGIET
ncbi:MAG: hypothetical protein Tsb0013_10020 [Phycisphaerales bacterium]